ncbi:MAG: terminase family protein [Terriglobia bacterium]|jgi:phage FluMu gp28-like protein
MAKGKRPHSSSNRSPNLPITRSESPDLPITGLLDGELRTSDSVLRTLLKTAIPVLPYQDRWIRDDSQLKVAVWSRQTGKSFAAALRATLKCLQKRTQYIILSKGERQSRLFMEKVKDFCLVFKELKMLPGFAEVTESEEKTMEVYFPHNRSRIIGLPANPDTARGYTGHIVLDEFAFHGDAHKIYAACFPIITRGYSIEVISTPNGTAGKFYEIAKQAGLIGPSDHRSIGPSEEQKADQPMNRSTDGPMNRSGIWSGHRVDIYDAIRQGLPANIDLLRAGCDDEETWLQEYGCQFVSDAANYIPIELISTCVSEEATTEWQELSTVDGQKSKASNLRPSTIDSGRDLYLGIDIGRKHDLTIAWLFEKVGDVLWSRVLLTLKGVTFDEQEKIIFSLLDLGVRRAGIDASGLGMMLAEHAVQKYGERVEPTTFTAQLKERLAPMVKQAFEDRTVRIPDNREVRADLNSVKRFVTPAGNVRFDAEHTDRGHADRFWALAMVVNAATHPPANFSEQAFLTGQPVMAGFEKLLL